MNIDYGIKQTLVLKLDIELSVHWEHNYNLLQFLCNNSISRMGLEITSDLWEWPT